MMFDYFLVAPCVVFTIFIVIVNIGTQILYNGFIDYYIIYYDTVKDLYLTNTSWKEHCVDFVYYVIKISLFEK